MKLHPDSQNILDIIRNSGRPPYHEMSVGQARAAYAAGRDATMGPPQAVASIEDFEIEGPGGPITIRLYRAQPKDRRAFDIFSWRRMGAGRYRVS